MGKHLSSSDVQSEIEAIVKSKLKEEGYIFNENPIENPNYKLDLYGQFEGKTVIGEIYAGIGKLQPAQKKKVITDCFKLVYVEQLLTKKDSTKQFRKLIVFVDDAIKNKFINNKEISNSWVKDALISFEIELKTIKISSEVLKELEEAKARQQEGMKISKSKK